MDRANDCFGGWCRGPLCLELLEDRQLLSEVPVARGLSLKPPAPAQAIANQTVAQWSPGASPLVRPLLGHGIGQGEAATPAPPSAEASHEFAAGLPRGGSGDTVSVFLGNGDGSFQPAIHVVARAGGGSMAEADFNRDGISDVATVNPNSHSVQVLLGNGDGSFKVASAFRIRGLQSSVSIADFNRDGIPDLVVAENTKKHARPRSEGAVEPAPGESLAGPSPPRRVVAMTQGALLRNLEGSAGKEAVSPTEAKTPPESSKGSDSPGIPGQEEEGGGLPALAAAGAAADLQEHATDLLPGARDLSPAPAGQLLVGLLPIDLPSLGRHVDEFFRRIDQLAEDAAEPGTMARLTPWLAAGAVLTAAYAFARRRFPRPGPSAAGWGGSRPDWGGFSGEAADRTP